MKRFIHLILSILLLFFLINPSVIAAEEKQVIDCSGQVINQETMEAMDTIYDNESLVNKWWIKPVRDLMSFWPINGIPTLVFGSLENGNNPYCTWLEKDTVLAEDGVFSKEHREKIINPIIKIITGSFYLFIMISMMVSTLKLSLTSYSPQSRVDFWEDVKMWFVAVVFMAIFIPFTNILFGLNNAFVQSVANQANTVFNVDVRTMFTVSGTGTSIGLINFTPVGLGSNLGIVVTLLVEWGLSLYLNIIYITRLIILTLLLGLGGLATVSLLYAKTRGFFGIWLKELCGAIFLPAIHAVVIFGMIGFNSQGAGTFFQIAMLIMFVPVTGLLTRLLQIGDSSTKLGQTMTMMGLGGVAGAVMVMRQAGGVVKGGSMTSNAFGSSTLGGDPGDGGGPSGPGGGLDTGSTSITAASSGMNSTTWQKMKQGASATGGVMGALMGAPLGPLGAGVGAAVGSKAAPAVMQSGRNVASSIANTARTIGGANGAKYEGIGGTGFKGMMNDVAARRQFFGNLGESVGSTFGSGGSSFGRKMGQGLSGVSRQSLMMTDEKSGGYGIRNADGNIVPPTLENLSKQYPGQNVQWRQTKDGSAFYLMDSQGNAQRQISPMGAADTNLRSGELRAIDYKFNNGSALQQQENGSYRYAGGLDSSIISSQPQVGESQGMKPQLVSQAISGQNLVTSSETGQQAITLGSVRSSTLNEAQVANPSSVSSVGDGSVGSDNSTLHQPVTLGNATNVNQVAATNVQGANVVNTSSKPSAVPGGTTPPVPTSPRSEAPKGQAGLGGSTEHLLRQSNAYILDANGTKFQDPRMDGANVNPDAYFSHVVAGANMESASDRVANLIGNRSSNNEDSVSSYEQSSAQGWSQSQNQSQSSRRKGVL